MRELNAVFSFPNAENNVQNLKAEQKIIVSTHRKSAVYHKKILSLLIFSSKSVYFFEVFAVCNIEEAAKKDETQSSSRLIKRKQFMV